MATEINEYENILNEFQIKLKNMGYNISSFEDFYIFKSSEELQMFLNSFLINLKTLEEKKEKNIIQKFIDSKYFLLCEFLPDNYKLNKKNFQIITLLFNQLNEEQKKEVLIKISKIKYLKQNGSSLKLEYFYIFYPYKQEYLDNIVNILNENQIFTFLYELKQKNKKEKEIYLKNISKQIEDIKKQPIYNFELYEIEKDKNLSEDKLDILKEAYFFKNLNLEEFKKDFSSEIYQCDKGQLINYIDIYVKYKDGYLTRNEFEFSKTLINEYSLPQDELKKDVLPVIEKYNITPKEVRECIDIGSKRDYGDTKKYLEFVIMAKENNYSDREIMVLLKDSKDKNTENILLKEEMINKFGKTEITKPINLNKLDNSELEECLSKNENQLEFINKK